MKIKDTFFYFANACLAMPHAPLLLMAACIGSLGTAFTAQYLFDEQPCILCLWQRIPYALVTLIAGLTYLRRGKVDSAYHLLLLIGVIFWFESGLAFYHTGVEQHWWGGTAGCVLDRTGDVASADSLRDTLLNTIVARCDVISWTFLGFSMANWNILFSFGLGLFTFMAAWTLRTGRKIFVSTKENHAKPQVTGKTRNAHLN